MLKFAGPPAPGVSEPQDQFAGLLFLIRTPFKVSLGEGAEPAVRRVKLSRPLCCAV